MNRRAFLKFLAVVPLAPKVAIDVLSKVEPPLLIHPKMIYGKVSISGSAMDRIWGPGIAELLGDHIRAQERLFRDIHYYVKPAHQR